MAPAALSLSFSLSVYLSLYLLLSVSLSSLGSEDDSPQRQGS